MHANRNTLRTCLLCLFVILVNGEKNDSVFVPTREWQTVNKGMQIPSGLHIRHNFETGVTEAKLMDPDETVDKSTDKGTNDSQTKSLSVHPDAILEKDDDDSATTKEHVKFPIKELKARLKKIKQDDTEALEKDQGAGSELTKKFKSYETIKKELKDLEINVTNDVELLGNYFQKFQGHKDSIAAGLLTLGEIEDIMDILNNLEFLIHQIDNAQIFTKMDGMGKIISPCLNGTNDKIKAEALRLLGAAVQSNPKVQLKALENDFVKKLLHILSTSKKLDVKSRCLFALSALTRQFPAAQKALVDHGGLEIFGNILSDDHLQIRMRVMRLINDLVKERQDLVEIAGVTPTEVKQREHKILEYELTGFNEKLVVQKYCKHLSNLMIGSYKEEITNELNSEDHEFLEAVYESMIALYPTCKSDFTTDKHVLLPAINNMLNFYESLGDDVNTDESDIFQHLLMLVKELRTIFETPHDEL